MYDSVICLVSNGMIALAFWCAGWFIGRYMLTVDQKAKASQAKAVPITAYGRPFNAEAIMQQRQEKPPAWFPRYARKRLGILVRKQYPNPARIPRKVPIRVRDLKAIGVNDENNARIRAYVANKIGYEEIIKGRNPTAILPRDKARALHSPTGHRRTPYSWERGTKKHKNTG